jgi:hypothetical protein
MRHKCICSVKYTLIGFYLSVASQTTTNPATTSTTEATTPLPYNGESAEFYGKNNKVSHYLTLYKLFPADFKVIPF